jgi:hypothetical protein
MQIVNKPAQDAQHPQAVDKPGKQTDSLPTDKQQRVDKEIELKLVIPFTAKPLAFAALEGLLGRCEESHQLITVYYDTPDLQLHRQRITLRVRKQGARWIQTLKGGGGVQGGLHSRNEWNWDLPSRDLDFSVLGEAVWDHSVDTDTLKPVFTTRFERLVWWHRKPGVQIEIALDEGHVSSETAQVPLIEIELELKEGSPAVLFELAGQIAAQVPCWPGFISKASKGYALQADQAELLFCSLEPLTPSGGVPASLDEAIRNLSLFLDANTSTANAMPFANKQLFANWQAYLLHLTWLRVFLAASDLSLSARLQKEMQDALDWLLRHEGKGFEHYLQTSLTVGQLSLEIARNRIV